jgi:chaperonin cofactor prefoldin
MITLPKLISQQDSRWANILLGFNTDPKYNIKNYGCLLSCLAMGLCYYDYNTDPEDLNNKLKKVGGFAGGGNYVWHSVEKITDKMKEALVRVGDTYPATDDQVKQIKDALDDGYPVILHIDYNPKTVADDQHWVLAIGYNPADENDITIVDPLGGTIKSLKSYLGWLRPNFRRTLIDYCILIGKVTQSNIKDLKINFDDAEGKRHTVGWYVYEWFIEKTRANKAEEKYAELNDSFARYKEANNIILEEKDSTIKKLSDTCDTLTTKNTTLTNKVSKLELKVDELNQQLLDQADYTIQQSIELLVSAFRAWLESVLKGSGK